jgi:hypothetical protein
MDLSEGATELRLIGDDAAFHPQSRTKNFQDIEAE